VKDVPGEPKRHEQSRSSVGVDPSIGQAGVDLYGRVADGGFVGQQGTLQKWDPPTHSGHTAQANVRVEVMAAKGAAGDRRAATAYTGVKDMMTEMNNHG